MDIQPLPAGELDIELIAVRQFMAEEIARLFRIPPHLLSAGLRRWPDRAARIDDFKR